LEIRIRRSQLLTLYVDPDVDKAPPKVYENPALLAWAAVRYPFPFATTIAAVPQRNDLMTNSESALSAASAQPEGRPR
jgi:hypothetical protein